MKSLRRSGDGPMSPDDALPIATEALDAEIIDESGGPGSALERREDGSIEVAGAVSSKHPAMIQLNKWLSENISSTDSADAAVADIIAQVLSADSVDEVLADTAVMGLREMLDVPFTLWGAKFNQSSFEAGAPFYCILDITPATTGIRGVASTGAQTVIAQIVRMHMLNAFPLVVKAIYATDKPTANGYRPYRLTKA
jgi:hypothetical protein